MIGYKKLLNLFCEQYQNFFGSISIFLDLLKPEAQYGVCLLQHCVKRICAVRLPIKGVDLNPK